ncbi:MAG: DEAD/DEAH box helicase [Firmicutes bacterium]|nr:DEAD/DEAH box helicase [Bacillota bacterium]
MATGNGGTLLEVEALDGDDPVFLSLAVPPDEPEVLPNELAEFDLRGLDSFTAWSRAHRILASTLVSETGLLSGARFGRVLPESYQLAPVMRILSKPRPSLLIADDVGLGKTIEAGFVLLELMARGRAERVLVVTPAGLMDQWQDELYDKFGLSFCIIGNVSDLVQAQTDLPAGVSPWDALPRVITSVDYIKKETVRNRALRKRWDLIIVDEAHCLAESGTPEDPYSTQRTRLGWALREACRGLLLLTATPHNGYPHAFRSLLELVEPTLATFAGSSEDRWRRIEASRIRRMKPQITRVLPDGIRKPVFPLRKVVGIPIHDLTDEDRQLLRKVGSYCSRVAKEAADTDDAEIIGFAMQIVKKRALSSRAALAVTLEHRLEALQKEEAREERPDRADLKDCQADLPLSEAATERTARKILRSAIPADERRRNSEIRALKDIQRLLRRLGERDPKIETLIDQVRQIQKDDPGDKVIVFTEYRDTLNSIRARIEREPDLVGRYVVLTGGLSRGQRLRRQEEFARPGVTILLATDAASEGLNLQHHCRRVIHVELPWNPNRLEQRNGRVDRYGQRREPEMRYLYYPDSPEDDVLARLVEKIVRMAEDRVSTPDILGVMAGASLDQELVRLDPEAADVEARKNQLVRLFDDRTEEFVRNVQPLLSVSGEQPGDWENALKMLNAAEPLFVDDDALEAVVLESLGPNIAADPAREGV